MNRKDAEKILSIEQLVSYNFFEDRSNYSDEMVIKKVSDKVVVYATDERAAIILSGKKEFDSEEDALDNFIKRLRALNKLINSR